MLHVDTRLQVLGTVLVMEGSQSTLADCRSEWLRRREKEGRIWENLSWIWGIRKGGQWQWGYFAPVSKCPSSTQVQVSKAMPVGVKPSAPHHHLYPALFTNVVGHWVLGQGSCPLMILEPSRLG